MRIEAYSQVQQIYKPRQTARNKQVSAASHDSDQLQISTAGRDYQTAKSAVAAVPDIREDLVASIRSRIDNGTYQVSTSAFAEKLLSKMDEMR
ncbi:MAG: flagellar biosynthesis anti-sigma factor FlgM [Lachnospiraceae bacterium]|nr:flagellar biosynthesis anti-sigma factor FlgM [Lachnospiraceae bacterium]MCM1239618.1 flagellar biosynthesis anti-sigma factor FlgM [Lachnospiraceae bacterium]MCM1302732.1 flagellar biosynthesis anti-sigma factor FlgM [Butyrivibrio sp.]MCM1342452.1 flagellar biosynthesis anti-sigma factor FlgM [Muribaculaceae bacterium]MCM1410242.1 flagellar biosynthesis anti-sigma factor FlgM [Lachnospiraceae bacterium]